jgi:hypothetical protein
MFYAESLQADTKRVYIPMYILNTAGLLFFMELGLLTGAVVLEAYSVECRILISE